MTGDDRTTYLHHLCPDETGGGWSGEGVAGWNVIVDVKTGIAFTVANCWATEDDRIPRICVAELLDAGFKP